MKAPIAFDLAKEKERVKFVLKKKGIHVVESTCSIVLDISGSEEQFYKDGTVQNALTRILPVPLACDTDGKIDTIFFSNEAVIAQPLTEDNFATYIAAALRGRGVASIAFGGTAYATALHELVELYQLEAHGEHGEEHDEEHETEEPRGLLYDLAVMFGLVTPTVEHHEEEEHHEEGEEHDEHGHHDEHGAENRHICWFVTDGRAQDTAETLELLEELRDDEAQMYIVFVTVGDEDFSFVKKVADRLPNVAMVSIDDLTRFAEDQDGTAYDLLTPGELCKWLKHEHGDHEHEAH